MKIPRPDDESKKLFRKYVPTDTQIVLRPMFGNESAFVNGNLFFGLFGNDLFVRLPDKDRDELLKERGASTLEPMKGRPMKEYVVLPKAWSGRPENIEKWVSRSLSWARKLPQKKGKK